MAKGTTRRQFVGLMAFGAGALLAACSNGAPSPTAVPSGNQQSATTGAPKAEAPGNATGGSSKVRFWYGLGGQLGEVILGQIEKFNRAQRAVEVEGIFQKNYNGVQEKLQAALVGGDVPEVVQIEIHATPQFASAGALAPIEPFFEHDPQFQFDDLVPATLLNQRWEGKLYAMPINRSTPLLYYNKKLFGEVGLDPEKPPRTWSAFYEAVKNLTQIDGGQARSYGFLPAADWWFFESIVWGVGGELLSEDLKQVTFADPGAPVLQMWADMIHQDKAARMLVGESAGEQRSQEFIQGRGGMLMNSTAGLGRFVRDVKDFEIGTAFMPHGEVYETAVPTGGAAAAIPAKVSPEKQRGAWEFVKWWISPEEAAFWSQNTGYFPVRKSAIEILTTSGYYEEYPQFKTTIDQLQFSREAPLTPHWPAIAKEITKGMEAILVNNEPALDALKKAQERAQAIVQR